MIGRVVTLISHCSRGEISIRRNRRDGMSGQERRFLSEAKRPVLCLYPCRREVPLDLHRMVDLFAVVSSSAMKDKT